MASQRAPAQDGEDDAEPMRRSEFHAFSNYQDVTYRVSKTIDKAIDAYAIIAGKQAEGAAISQGEAADARRYIKKAALMLLPELTENRDSNEFYRKVWRRWEEDGTAGLDVEEWVEYPPYLRGITTEPLRGEAGIPGWLEQFVRDIRQAGWEIGHLQAGRTTKVASADPAEDEANQMLKGL